MGLRTDILIVIWKRCDCE